MRLFCKAFGSVWGEEMANPALFKLTKQQSTLKEKLKNVFTKIAHGRKSLSAKVEVTIHCYDRCPTEIVMFVTSWSVPQQ